MNQMGDEPDGHQTCLLCLWRVQRQGKWQWCPSLESRHAGERQSFAELEQPERGRPSPRPGVPEHPCLRRGTMDTGA
jgi:hypothetical protein